LQRRYYWTLQGDELAMGFVRWRGVNMIDTDFYGETAVAQWLRYCATNPKVAGSIPDGVIGIFSLA
jgi:hypothetical protein